MSIPARGIRLVGLLVAILAGVVAVPSAAAASGEMRVLYALTTWDPMPFTHADAERVAAETDAFYKASSSGRFSMPGSVAGPIQLPRAVFDSCDATALRNAAPPATFAGYDRIVFVTPAVASCRFVGEANPTEVLLNGQLFRALAVHELGHTLGLGHASRWSCERPRSCELDEYGSEFSVMGGGDGDLNAFEKAELDWLTGVVRPTTAGTHEIGPIEGGTTLPQALVVETAEGEFWFESRGRATPSFTGSTVQPAGVAVIMGLPSTLGGSPYPRENLLLPNPRGGERFGYVAGEAFERTGAFRVAVERHTETSATLAFEWRDRVAPAAPRLTVRATGRGRFRLTWDPPLERGSGVETYTIVVDGRAVRAVDGQVPYLNSIATLRLTRGPHRIGVFATDRAGNRGRTAVARVRVR